METQLSRAHRSGRWSCTFGHKTTSHNNPIYGDSPSAAMPKYGVCCLTSTSTCHHGIRCKHISYLHIWPQMRHAQIWAYYILMTSAISIYGHKRDKDMGTNGAYPNMGILYTDYDISNLHIWAYKGQGNSDPVVLSHRSSRYAHIPVSYTHLTLPTTL